VGIVLPESVTVSYGGAIDPPPMVRL
jgi:hypothetical protein